MTILRLDYTLVNLGIPPFSYHLFSRKYFLHAIIFLDVILLTTPLLLYVPLDFHSTLLNYMLLSYIIMLLVSSLYPQPIFPLLSALICVTLPLLLSASFFSLLASFTLTFDQIVSALIPLLGMDMIDSVQIGQLALL